MNVAQPSPDCLLLDGNALFGNVARCILPDAHAACSKLPRQYWLPATKRAGNWLNQSTALPVGFEADAKEGARLFAMHIHFAELVAHANWLSLQHAESFLDMVALLLVTIWRTHR